MGVDEWAFSESLRTRFDSLRLKVYAGTPGFVGIAIFRNTFAIEHLCKVAASAQISVSTSQQDDLITALKPLKRMLPASVPLQEAHKFPNLPYRN